MPAYSTELFIHIYNMQRHIYILHVYIHIFLIPQAQSVVKRVNQWSSSLQMHHWHRQTVSPTEDQHPISDTVKLMLKHSAYDKMFRATTTYSRHPINQLDDLLKHINYQFMTLKLTTDATVHKSFNDLTAAHDKQMATNSNE